MTDDEATKEYREFKSRFRFQNAGGTAGPAVKPPFPCIVFKTRAMPPSEGDQIAVDMIVDWHRKLLDAFRRVLVTKESEVTSSTGGTKQRIVCTDPYHDGYWIDTSRMNFESWQRVALPDGDYTLFATPDYKNGIFVHPWQPSVCVFGQVMLKELGMLGGKIGGRVIGLEKGQQAEDDDGEAAKKLPLLFRDAEVLDNAILR